MMAPTALDLAVLPFLLLALLELMQGRLAWTAPAAALAAILLFAHPWIFAIVAPAAAALVVVALVAPWPRGAGAPLSVRGVALAALLLGTGLTLALSGCAGVCGPGFRNVVPDLQRYADVAPVALAGLAIVAAVLLAAARPLQRLLDRLHDTPRPSVARAVVATLLVVGVVALAVPAHVQGLPHQVDLVAMVGVPTLALAAAGLAAFALRPTPAAAAGAALALTTLPFTLYDAFGSPFWPHRTAVYLALGLALLAGSAGAMLADFLHGAWQALRRVRPQAAGRRVAFASVAPLLAVSAVSAAVVAQTPGYEDGWYRLYGACETGALADVGAMLEEDPELLVVAGSWQAKLVVAAHADEPARVWYSPTYYADPGNRRGLADRTIVAVDEPHLDRGAGSASFLDDAGWEPIGSWCTGPEGPTVRAAIHRAGGPA